MNILFKGLSLVCISLSLQAITLKELIQSTIQNNQNIKANQFEIKAKQKTYESVKNIYNPNLIAGASFTRLNLDRRNTQVGSTSVGFIKFSMDLYDGGKNKATKQQKMYEYKSAKFNNITNTKELLLQVVNLFFNAKTTIENIKVFEKKGILLKAEYERVKEKYKLKMATIDEVLKLKSEYEANKYTIEELKYQKEELLKNLELLTGVKITTLDDSTLPDIMGISYQKSSTIKALEYSIKANEENVKITKSIKKPKITIEDTLSFYKYNDYNEQLLADLPYKQNQFTISLTYNLFDTSSKEKIESAKLIKVSNQLKLNYVKNQEKINFILAQRKLQIQKVKIESAKSALEMANSVYKIIKSKYENGVVDNITYLDALSKKIYNEALYNQALNDYEIAKANYYFNSGVNYKTIISKW